MTSDFEEVLYILIWILVMNTLYVRYQTKDNILDIVAARAGMRINKVNSVKKDAFPQHNISNAKYKEILIIIYKYKYTFGLAVVGG